MKQFERTSLIIGEENTKKLNNSHVIIFGIGVVGSYVVEALTRAGIGTLSIVDFDKVDETNINRQIIATHSTIGKKKIEAAKERILDINPNINLKIYDTFVSPDTIEKFDFSSYDYVVDAIDNVTGKLLIIQRSIESNTPVISSLGTANKLDPSKLILTDISKTHTCPLAKIVRLKLRQLGINHLDVLFSSEEPIKPSNNILGSMPYVPSVGGLLIASHVIKNLIK